MMASSQEKPAATTSRQSRSPEREEEEVLSVISPLSENDDDPHEKNSPMTRRRPTNTSSDIAEEDEDEDDTALGRLASATPGTRGAGIQRSRSRSASNVPPPPDGGTVAWLQVVCGWLVIFTTWGYINSFGAFQAYYVATALPDQSASSISWIGSLQGFLSTAIGAFTGRALDAGLFRPTFAIGAALQLAGIFAMSASDEPKYWQLILTQGVLTGLGVGVLFTPTLALVATWFGPRRGLAIGLATTGNSTGGIVYPLIVRQLLPRIGFAWTVRAFGLVSFVCLGVSLIVMRSRLPPRKSGPLFDWGAFKEATYSSYVAGLFFFVWASYYSYYYVASYGVQTLGMSYTDSNNLIMLVNGAGLPFRVLIPMLADRIGPLNMITLGVTSVGIVILSWMAVNSVTGLYIFTAFLGATSGATQSLMPTTIASITRRLDTVGTRLGMCFTVISVASLTGPPIGGALQGAAGGDWRGAQAWAGVSALAGGLGLLASRTFKVGWKVKANC